MAQIVKNLSATQETRVLSLGREDTLEKGMATRSSIFVWRIPGTEEPGGLQSTGLERIGRDQHTHTHTHTHTTVYENTAAVGTSNYIVDPMWKFRNCCKQIRAELPCSLMTIPIGFSTSVLHCQWPHRHPFEDPIRSLSTTQP